MRRLLFFPEHTQQKCPKNKYIPLCNQHDVNFPNMWKSSQLNPLSLLFPPQFSSELVLCRPAATMSRSQAPRSKFWTGIVLEQSPRSRQIYCTWRLIRAEMGKARCPWNVFIRLESERCACQQRNAMNWMECTGELRYSPCKNIVCQYSLAKSDEAWMCLKVLKISQSVRELRLWSL